MRRCLVSVGVVLGVVVAGCSSGASEAEPAGSTEAAAVTAAATTTIAPESTPPEADPTSTAAPTTTVGPSPEELAVAFSGPGEYPVGVIELALAGGQQVVVWYPAAEGTSGTYTYDARDYTGESLRALLTADLPATFTIDAGLDAPGAAGTFPVALYSHGFSGFNVTASFLTSHLASHGVVVAAPEHPSRDLAAATAFALGDQSTAVTELLDTIELLRAEAARPGSPLEGRVDIEQVTAMGHSAGGGTVLAAALDERIDTYVSMSSGAFGRRDPVTSTTGPPPEMPDKPSLFITGKLDQVASWSETTKPAFDRAPSPSTFWAIDGVGHVGFTDICTLGDGLGIIGIAEASGLSDFLDASPQFRLLGQDGCLPPNLPVDQTWPIILNTITAFVLGDSVPGASDALTPEVGATFAVDVTIEQK